jgi:hypothetical protein
MSVSLSVEELARNAKAQAARRKSPRSIAGRDPSLRWPHLYDLLRAKGYDKEKAARISNSRLRYRKKGRLQGLPWKQADSKRALSRVRKEYESKRSRTASALVAACYEAACRPPTSGGTGGSSPKGRASATALSLASKAKAASMRGGASTNTSAYPADTFKATRASDSHPMAPGHDDRSAVRGHRGVSGTEPERRIPRAGETVDIYRDLGHGREFKRGFPDGLAFSVRHASAMDGSKTGLVVASTTGIILNNGRPAWAHSAKRDAEREGKRGVHGFIRGEVVEYRNPDRLAREVQSGGWQKVTYYPGTQDFFDPTTRRRFVGSDQVALVNGEFFAKGAKFIDETAPLSPIEQRMRS